jgi:NitT/TauT family transport system permease protein
MADVTREHRAPAPQADGLAPRARRRLAQIAPAAISGLLVLLVWQAACDLGHVSPTLLPSPLLTARKIVEIDELLLRNAWPTLVEAVVGLAVSVAVAVPLGILLAARGLLSRGLFPLVLGTQNIPKVALAPLLVVWFGFGNAPKFILVFLITFFPIVITTVTGIRSVPREMIELGSICKMSRLQRLWRLELPHALPTILSGVKVATALAMIAAIVSEFVGSIAGLGFLIVQAQGNVNTPLIFSAIVLVSVIGFLLYGLVGLIEKLLIPWHISQRRKGG